LKLKQKMREIVLDTETTGLDPASGHRLVEIAGIELRDCIPTGEKFHIYLDPQRDMPDEAFRVHGLSAEFLTGKPLFAEVVDDLLRFVGDDRLVIHNAEFDMRFLNAELQKAGRPRLPAERAIDTLALARRKHPGSSNSLDALCARYRIDASRRVKHSVLLEAAEAQPIAASKQALRNAPLLHLIEACELDAHRRFVEAMGKSAIWQFFFEAQ